MPIKVNQPIPLSIQLSDEDPAAFPQVTLLDAAGAALGASPVDLAHVSNGLYKDESVLMPTEDRVFAQYKVYSDAGHSIPHFIHCSTLLEVFERDLVGEKVDQLAITLASLTGSAEQLAGTIEDFGLLTGAIDDIGLLSGTIEDNGALTGTLEDNILIGVLHDSGQLTGVIEC